MRIPIDYDPRQHVIQDLPVTQSLRRDTGVENIVTYCHQGNQSWIVALQSYDKKSLLEIDLLCPDEPTSKYPSRKDYARIRNHFTPASTTKEIKQGWDSWHNDGVVQHCEDQQAFSDAIESLARSIAKRYGNVAAERYLRSAGKGTGCLNVRSSF